ncbi:TonB-dependent receptor [Novosphingobium sp. PC22D]|uniref:TonB-dependent receptor n=1 Tax=Novosphingobium sp. PC22D TaxID=1962403 RepID=UPI001F0AA63B|nr:TonB-dependent receptor [Novosphingobium sp. PC22D]
MTDRIDVTLGGRYTEETKHFSPEQYIAADRTGTLTGPGGTSCALIPANNPDCNLILPPDTATTKANEFTGSASIAYRAADGVMVYASYARGFKSGGFTQRIFPPEPVIPSFDPEFVTTYEVGTKLELLRRTLRLNSALFWSDYSDLQIILNDGVAPKVRNAGKARIRGVEVELEAAPARWLRITGGLGYTDAEYRALDERAAGITLGSALPNTPEWTANLGASLSLAEGPLGELRLRGDWSCKSGHYKDAINTHLLKQEGYSLINASIAWASPDERWTVSAGATNLTDKAYLLSGYADPVAVGVVEGAFSRPREWFLRTRLRF